LSDWLGKRKVLAITGYALAAAMKPVFALAGSVGILAAARFIDRIGKGIRGAPRDALVADLSPTHLRGARIVTPEEAAVLAAVFSEDGELPARPAGASAWSTNFRRPS
jgi:hypothetical protein